VLPDAVHGADTLGFESSNNLGRCGFQRFGLGSKPHRLDDVASDAAGQATGNGFNFRQFWHEISLQASGVGHQASGQPGSTYYVTVSAQGFANWTSTAVVLKPGQYAIVTGSKLRIAEALTTITVAAPVASPEEIAAEQVKAEEQQRIFGIIPNFYVVYDHDAAPLTTKLKFKLATNVFFDPVTVIGVATFAGINQAADNPNYGQGAKGYAERFGAGYADGAIDIMVGGAILPSLLHQDPRYFYQGRAQTSLALCTHSPAHSSAGRQRTLAAKLLDHRWGSGLGGPRE